MGITILGGSDKWKFGSVTSYGIHQTCTMDGGCGYTTYTILTTQLWPALSEVEVHSNHPDLAQHLCCVCVCVCVCVGGGKGGREHYTILQPYYTSIRCHCVCPTKSSWYSSCSYTKPKQFGTQWESADLKRWKSDKYCQREGHSILVPKWGHPMFVLHTVSI